MVAAEMLQTGWGGGGLGGMGGGKVAQHATSPTDKEGKASNPWAGLTPVWGTGTRERNPKPPLPSSPATSTSSISPSSASTSPPYTPTTDSDRFSVEKIERLDQDRRRNRRSADVSDDDARFVGARGGGQDGGAAGGGGEGPRLGLGVRVEGVHPSIRVDHEGAEPLMVFDGSFEDDEQIFYLDGHGSKAAEAICMMWRDGGLCDVVLKAKGRMIEANRFTLAAASPYFKTLFTNLFKEGDKTVLEISKVDGRVLATVVEAIYERKISLSMAKIPSIMLTVDLLQFECVRDACHLFLENRITVETAPYVRSIARNFNMPVLRRKAIDLLRSDMFGVSTNHTKRPSKWILDLSLCSMVELLDVQNLEFVDEEQLLKVLLAWVGHDPAGRRAQLAPLLRLIRLPEIPATKATEFVDMEPLIYENPECVRQFLDAMLYREDPVCRGKLALKYNWNRAYVGYVSETIYIYGFLKQTDSFWSRPFKDGAWEMHIIPRGNGNSADMLSINLFSRSFGGPRASGPRKYSLIRFTVVSKSIPQRSVVKELAHTFHGRDSNCGHVEICRHSILRDETRKLLVDGTLELKIEMWPTYPSRA